MELRNLTSFNFLFFIVLSILVESYGQRQCFICQYPGNDACKDAPTVNELASCTSGDWCMTTRTKEFGEVTVNRGCAKNDFVNGTEPEECVQEEGSPNFVCYCNTEACNSQPSQFTPLQLQCYQCDYPGLPECRDRPPENRLGTCKSGDWCVMTKSREYGKVEVTRGCALDEVPEDGIGKCSKKPGETRDRCYCQGMACNSEESGYPVEEENIGGGGGGVKGVVIPTYFMLFIMTGAGILWN